MNEPVKHVGIFESDSYRIAKENLGDSVLMEEIEGEFTSKLSDNPLLGDPVPYTKELFVLITKGFYPRVPSVRVLYRYSTEIDPFNVELISIGLADNTPYENSE